MAIHILIILGKNTSNDWHVEWKQAWWPHLFCNCSMSHQPGSQGSLLPIPMERERDPGQVWSRGSRTKLIPREESFVSQLFFCLVRFHRSHNDRKGEIDLLSLQL